MRIRPIFDVFNNADVPYPQSGLHLLVSNAGSTYHQHGSLHVREDVLGLAAGEQDGPFMPARPGHDDEVALDYRCVLDDGHCCRSPPALRVTEKRRFAPCSQAAVSKYLEARVFSADCLSVL